MHERFEPMDFTPSLPGYRFHVGVLGLMVGLFPRGPLVNSFVAVPYWLIFAAIVAAAVVPGWRQRRRERRSARRRCVACGYDLRATPGRCPECGAVPAGQMPTRPA